MNCRKRSEETCETQLLYWGLGLSFSLCFVMFFSLGGARASLAASEGDVEEDSLGCVDGCASGCLCWARLRSPARSAYEHGRYEGLDPARLQLHRH